MNGMALLCNLHADGPETLHSLREGGCSSLGELVRLEPGQLSKLLGFTGAEARRFLREGRLLSERLGDPDLEAEEQLCAPRPAAELRPEPRPAAAHGREREILARVVEHWSDLDPAQAIARTREVQLDEPEEAIVGVARTPLLPGALDALDETVCAELHARGIASLEALAELTLEELERCSGLPYTRARRLHYLARQAAGSDLIPALPPQPSAKISLAFPDLGTVPVSAPEAEPEGPAGPFA